VKVTRTRVSSMVATLALSWHIASIAQDETDGPSLRIMFPRDEVILETGKIDLLCVADASIAAGDEAPLPMVDGTPGAWAPLPWETVARPVLLSRLALAPGAHEIRVGAARLRVYVAPEDSSEDRPEGWPTLRDHSVGEPGWKDCTICHDESAEDGDIAMPLPETPSACLVCHPREDVELTHFHPADPLSACQTCHAVHGATEDSLRSGAITELCSGCHE